MKDLSELRIVLTETPDFLLGSLGPILARANFHIERIPRAQEAIERLVAEPYDSVITSFPLMSVSFRTFLVTLRKPPSASANAKLLVTVDDDHRGEVSPYLVERGIDEVVSPLEDPLLVQHAVSNILGVAPRAAVRLVLRLEAALEAGPKSLFCTSVDLSTSGALIESDDVLPLGTHATLKLFLPDVREPVAVNSQVVRHADPRYDRARGFAVRFLALDPVVREHLDRFLAPSG